MKLIWASMLMMVLMTIGMCNGCGYGPKQDEPAATVQPAANDFVLRGSISSAWPVKVDGEDFSDMEAFYTAEVDRLSKKAADAGYVGYDAKFEAEIGFSDLTRGMTVYVATKSNRGYQGKTQVGFDDTFALKLPADGAGDTYQIRANKRIGVVLTKGATTMRFCYNFSAQEMEVPYAAKDLPIRMSTLNSELTAYECAQDVGGGGITLPTAPGAGSGSGSSSGSDVGSASDEPKAHAEVGGPVSWKLYSTSQVNAVSEHSIIQDSKLSRFDSAKKDSAPMVGLQDSETPGQVVAFDTNFVIGSTAQFNYGEVAWIYSADNAKSVQMPDGLITRNDYVSIVPFGMNVYVVVAGPTELRLALMDADPALIGEVNKVNLTSQPMAVLAGWTAIYVLNSAGSIDRYNYSLNLTGSYPVDLDKLPANPMMARDGDGLMVVGTDTPGRLDLYPIRLIDEPGVSK